MTSLMQRGLSFLAGKLPPAAGGPIVYTRGASSITIDATFGSSEFQVESAAGMSIEHSDRDFIVSAADLVLDAATATPRRGDRISVGSELFEVLAPGGAKVYRDCDARGERIRIHAKRCSA